MLVDVCLCKSFAINSCLCEPDRVCKVHITGGMVTACLGKLLNFAHAQIVIIITVCIIYRLQNSTVNIIYIIMSLYIIIIYLLVYMLLICDPLTKCDATMS